MLPFRSFLADIQEFFSVLIFHLFPFFLCALCETTHIGFLQKVGFRLLLLLYHFKSITLIYAIFIYTAFSAAIRILAEIISFIVICTARADTFRLLMLERINDRKDFGKFMGNLLVNGVVITIYPLVLLSFSLFDNRYQFFCVNVFHIYNIFIMI